MRLEGRLFRACVLLSIILPLSAWAQQKPRITLEEFFNSVAINSVRISPAGDAVLVATSRADWNASRFRQDIWITYLDGSAPRLLTQSGHDSQPKWSPDGKWIAFVSDRASDEAEPADTQMPVTTSMPEKPVTTHPQSQQPLPKPQTSPTSSTNPPGAPGSPVTFDLATAPAAADEKPEKEIPQLYVISTSGGEAVRVTSGREGVHAFDWSPDSAALYVATRVRETNAQREQHRKEWADVKRYREDEHGDAIVRIALQDAIAHAAQIPAASAAPAADQKQPTSAASTPVAQTPYQVSELQVSPDGQAIAFATDSRSSRVEDTAPYEIYVAKRSGGEARQLTHNQAIERDLRWSPDGKRIFFTVGMGSVEGAYLEVQPRLYSIDAASGAIHRSAPSFGGAIGDYDIAADGSVIATGHVGTNAGVHTSTIVSNDFPIINGWKGTYGALSLSRSSGRLAFVYSSLQRPTEVYVADRLATLSTAKPITSFHSLFASRDLPQGEPYKWKADDGTEVEGMLIYPPGKFHNKQLRMLTLIHGGPEAVDADRFEADWYDWAILAASNGWLVFRPNYRGSIGYGDKFEVQIRPNIVSLPGRDILTGVDALVRDGIADPNRLAIGGYSYGGYMTNWLITQTDRFEAAVTGAGAVEHAANWGNDDLTYDDAWYLGGLPWEAKETYDKEAALWQIQKVKTPTHMVAGTDDIRVSVLESYLMERALQALGVPHSLLLFPGEGHSLRKNPWHGRIKVREELKWLEKYVPGP